MKHTIHIALLILLLFINPVKGCLEAPVQRCVIGKSL